MSILTEPDVFRLINRDGITIYQCRANNLKDALELAVTDHVPLHNLDLSYQDLSFANLDDARFYDVCFTGANMTGANISEAVFQKCDFNESCLLGACLAYCTISQCRFVNTEFAGLDISCARFFFCKFVGGNVFFLDFAAADKFVESYLYDDADQDALNLQCLCMRLSVNGRHYIINPNHKAYVGGQIYEFDQALYEGMSAI